MEQSMKKSAVVYLGLLALSVGAQAQLIRPDSAVAGSEFSILYNVGLAINGSGLPIGFGLGDLHATYNTGNHWTTQAGAIAAGTAWAEFSFNSAQTLGAFHLWNHRSNGVSSNPYYAVTQFDLIFKDASGAVIGQLLNQAAVGGLGTGAVQSFNFAAVSGVSSVRFVIDTNSRPPGTPGADYTGVAEVAFGAPIPEPTTAALLLAGLAAVGSVARRRSAFTAP
jgi:hypothetical protein